MPRYLQPPPMPTLPGCAPEIAATECFSDPEMFLLAYANDAKRTRRTR